jgi:hypothetical protein
MSDSKEDGVVNYYTTIPNSRTHMADGREIRFTGGYFSTNEEDVIAHLDSLARSSAAPVYRMEQPDAVSVQLAAAAEGAAVPAQQITHGDSKLMAAPGADLSRATAQSLKPVTAAQVAAQSSAAPTK